MVRKTIGKAVAGAKQWAKGVKKSQRRNRMWVVVVRGGWKYYLVEPAYYEKYALEADQCRRFESPSATGQRLQELLAKDVESELYYLGHYKLKGGVTYRDLYVCYVLVSEEAVLRPEVEVHLRAMTSAATESERKLRAKVLHDLQERLSHEPRQIYHEIMRRGTHDQAQRRGA